MTCLFPEENSTLQWKRFREKQSDFADFLHAQKAALHTKESWKFNIIYLKRNIQTKSHFTSCVYKDMEIIQNMWIGTPLSDTKTI